jgi:hypothetical protein
VTQSPGFSYQDTVSRWPRLPGRPAVIGGVTVTCEQAQAALAALERAGGVMVRQVLSAARSPLAACDYHAAAAPFRQPPDRPASGRGAAGRPLTRRAFARAVTAALEAAGKDEPARHYAAELDGAVTAFAADERYAAEMARAAVALREREHAARLRDLLAAEVSRAVQACTARSGQFACAADSACGTGDCRLAAGTLAGLAVTAPAGRLPRPANHNRAGQGFSVSAALAALAAAVPLDMPGAVSTVRARGADYALAAESASAG